MHSSEKNVRTRRERTVECSFVTVPFAGSEGCIAVLAEQLGKCFLIFGDDLSVAVYVHQTASGKKHRTTGLRDGTVESTHYMSLGE